MKILSLDIGSHCIKAVELDITFGRIELSDFFQEKIDEPNLTSAASPKESEQEDKKNPRKVLSPGQVDAIKKIITTKTFKFDRLCVNFPKGWVTTRLFHFPTKDRKVIQNSLNFELDDDIPFSIDDVIYDFATLNNEGNNSTIYTALALKSDILGLLSELQIIGLDPDCISIEPWSFGYLLKKTIPKEYEGRPVCVVNIGATLTSIHMFLGDQPVFSHTSTCAGNEVTKAIAQNYGLSFENAEKAKTEGSFLLTAEHLNSENIHSISEDQQKFSEVISVALIPMVREIKQTMMSYKSQYKISPRAIFVTGGTSLIANIQLYLEEQLKIPVFTFNYMSKVVGQTLQLSENSEAHLSNAVGLALANIKVERNHQINFRKEEFSKNSSFGNFNFKEFKKPLKYLAASLAFVYLNLIIQGFILSSRSTSQDLALEKSIKNVLGPVTSSVMTTYKTSPSTLKNAVNKEISKYKKEEVIVTNLAPNALDILNQVSTGMPKDMILDVNYFQIKDGKFKLSGFVDPGSSANSNADKILKHLQDSRSFTDINKDKVELDPKTKKTHFEFSAKVAEAGNVKNK